MRAIPGITITDDVLVSSTCAEPASGEAEWNSGSTYGLAATVITAATHRKFESLQASNTNHAPPVWPETVNDWWLDVGPVARWAMFDTLRNTGTTAASPLVVELEPGVRFNSVALLGLVADQVTITLTVDGDDVYSRVVDLNTRVVVDWYSYFFNPFTTKAGFVLFDIPPYSNAILTVEVTRESGDVTCGALLIGSYVYVGRAQYGAESDAVNYSRVERNDFGDAVLIQRRSVPKTSQTTLLAKAYLADVLALRTAANAIPIVWTAIDDSDHEYYQPLLILGFYRTFTINMAHPEDVVIQLELEEV